MRKRNETFAEHEKELADRIAAAEAELELRTKVRVFFKIIL